MRAALGVGGGRGSPGTSQGQLRLLSARDNNGDAKRMGAEAQEPRTYAVILIKTQTIQQATPYNQSASNVYAELNVIWIVRSQTDGSRVAGGK